MFGVSARSYSVLISVVARLMQGSDRRVHVHVWVSGAWLAGSGSADGWGHNDSRAS